MARMTHDLLFKILLIGDSGCGKTCIVSRLCDESFQPSFVSTIGIDFRVKTIRLHGKLIKLQIWDTAGQERFRTITNSYYRGAMGIMLVYDITRKKSFDNLSNWLRCINEHASENVQIMMLGNKCDTDSARVVPKAKGEAIARDHRIGFLETSAKLNTNIEEAFTQLAETIFQMQASETAEGAAMTDAVKIGSKNAFSLKSRCCQ